MNSKLPKLGDRILVVDDTPANIQSIAAILKEKGYQISVATNGKQALNALEQIRPDLILLDVMMPEMDGFETCRRLKTDDRWRSIPVIFLTAKTETTDIVNGFELGAVDYVGKPFNAHELLARVNTHLTIDRLSRENERLLLNILPSPIAARLKSGDSRIADRFDSVSVLFADIVSFTELASSMSADSLVELLNELFTLFDRTAQEMGIEKIKTVGDAYMAVSGMPEVCEDHVERITELALDLMRISREFRKESGNPVRLRIGINSGPVVAGVIGRNKFIYDLWGDTVNLASRMESSGLPDCIQVTKTVVEKIGDRYPFESRGGFEIKGKGTVETWILSCASNE
jgi:class 3 adenylate cyclase